MTTVLSDSQRFQVSEMGFWTAKREGGEYIRMTGTELDVSVQLTPAEGGQPVARTFAAGDIGAGDYKAWMRTHEEKCREGKFTQVVLSRVSKADD